MFHGVIEMGSQCFRKKDSSPPICGVHGVALVLHRSSDDLKVSFFGDFRYFQCPVSNKVVADESKGLEPHLSQYIAVNVAESRPCRPIPSIGVTKAKIQGAGIPELGLMSQEVGLLGHLKSFMPLILLSLCGNMAESEGFEPPVAFRLRLISSQVHSTGLCQLSAMVQV
jgi:hypothetical protein